MREKWRNLPLKVRMISLLVLCWIVPIVVISVILTLTVNRKMTVQLQENIKNSSSKVILQIESEMDDVRQASRNATYFDEIRQAYEEYKTGNDEQKLYEKLTLYLAQQYRYDESLNCAMLFLKNEQDRFFSTYSSGNTYDRISEFKENHLGEMQELSDTLDTSMRFCQVDDSFYLVRNMVDENYSPYAVLLLEINKEHLFAPLKTIWGQKSAGVYLDGELIFGEDVAADVLPIQDDVISSPQYIKKAGRDYVYAASEADNRTITYVVALDEQIVRGESGVSVYILIVILASIIPLIFYIFNFFDSKVTKPIEGLVKAADEIMDENYGYLIEADGGSRDLNYLNHAFNDMSEKLKTQFEQIYLEELAVRDANIKALQSQINPHFINNTLEIINWEARLNGVYKVSAMIEALSTMLNATLDRKNVQYISLSEELEYVDAYLYVISERMGSRLTISKEIDESLLRENVPRLIAQPIIENAVEHGIKTSSEGYIHIHVFAKDPYMYIEIRNSGRMSKDDEDKVNQILSSDGKNEMHSTSIGINNVNRRLRLMYGPTCGLTIYNDGEETVNLLTFMREEKDEEDSIGGDSPSA